MFTHWLHTEVWSDFQAMHFKMIYWLLFSERRRHRNAHIQNSFTLLHFSDSWLHRLLLYYTWVQSYNINVAYITENNLCLKGLFRLRTKFIITYIHSVSFCDWTSPLTKISNVMTAYQSANLSQIQSLSVVYIPMKDHVVFYTSIMTINWHLLRSAPICRQLVCSSAVDNASPHVSSSYPIYWPPGQITSCITAHTRDLVTQKCLNLCDSCLRA